MASQSPPKINTAYTFYVSLVSQSDTKTFQANPSLTAGDVKVAIDDGAPANLATLPVVDADYTKRVKVALSSSEMNGDNITVIFSDASGAEWCDLTVNLQTVTNQFDDLATATNLATVDTVVDGIKAVTDNLPDSGALSSLATASALSTAQTDLDTLTGTDGATLATSQPNYAPATAASVAALNDVSTSDVQTAAAAALTAYDPPTKAELDSGLAALNDLSAAEIRTALGMASADLDAQLDAIVADTGELQADWANGGRLDLLIDAILEDTGTTIPALIAALNDLSAAEVNAQVVDALSVDTYAEPGSVPAATATLAAKLGWLFFLARNRITQTATTQTALADDGSTSVATSTVSDDGSTFVRGEWS